MSLNSRGESMNHRSRQQSMNAKRKNANRKVEGDQDIVILWALDDKLSNLSSENIIAQILSILQQDSPKENMIEYYGAIKEFMETPRVWWYFMVGEDLYEILGLPLYSNWHVSARKIDYSSSISNIQETLLFPYDVVRDNLVGEWRARSIIVSQILWNSTFIRWESEKYIII